MVQTRDTKIDTKDIDIALIRVIRSPTSEDVDFRTLSEMTHGYSGADIAQVI